MGKPRDIGIRENSVNQLKLAQALLENYEKGDNLEVVITLIKTTITHMNLYPDKCEFSDGCREYFEEGYEYEPEEPMRDESRE